MRRWVKRMIEMETDLRCGQLAACVDGVVQELDTSQVTDTLVVGPVDEDVIDGGLLVLVNHGGVVGVGNGAGDVTVGPSAAPVVPDGDTTLVLDGKVVGRGEEALLGVVGFSAAGVGEGDPRDGDPVSGTHGLLDGIEDEVAPRVVADHVGDVLDAIDDHAWALEHWRGLRVPSALGK